MKVCIPTIQHSGTKLVANMFRDVGFNWASMNEFQDNAVHIGHISSGQMNNIHEHLHAMQGIVPIRHPYSVQASWRLRGKPLIELAQNWRRLVEEIASYDPYYVVVDNPDRRDDDIRRINIALGLNLKNDWEPVNSVHNTYNIHYNDIKPDPIIEKLVDEIKGFLTLFY